MLFFPNQILFLSEPSLHISAAAEAFQTTAWQGDTLTWSAVSHKPKTPPLLLRSPITKARISKYRLVSIAYWIIKEKKDILSPYRGIVKSSSKPGVNNSIQTCIVLYYSLSTKPSLDENNLVYCSNTLVWFLLLEEGSNSYAIKFMHNSSIQYLRKWLLVFSLLFQ